MFSLRLRVLKNKLSSVSRSGRRKRPERNFRPINPDYLPRLLFFSLIPLTLFLIFRTDIFSVSQVDIYLDGKGYNYTEIKDFITQRLINKNIVLINQDSLTKDIQKNFLTVKDVKLYRRPPKRLSIFVIQRNPIAVLLPKLGEIEASPSAIPDYVRGPDSGVSHDLLVDESGLIFTEGSAGGLPIMLVDQDRFVLGMKLDRGSEKFLLGLVSAMKESGLALNSVREFNGDVLAVLSDRSFILLNPSKDLSSQVLLIKMIQEKYKIEAKNIAKIDLRYKKTVVEFR